MNLNGLIRMVLNMVLRKGMKAMAKPGGNAKRRGSEGPAAGAGPDHGQTARDAAKRARKAAQLTRRLGR